MPIKQGNGEFYFDRDTQSPHLISLYRKFGSNSNSIFTTIAEYLGESIDNLEDDISFDKGIIKALHSEAKEFLKIPIPDKPKIKSYEEKIKIGLI